MIPTLLAFGLVSYNNLLNLWPPFSGGLYVPCNALLGLGLFVMATGPLDLSLRILGMAGTRPGGVLLGAGLGLAAAAVPFLALRFPLGAAGLADRRLAGISSRQLLYRVLLRVPVGTAALEEIAFRGVLLALWLPQGARLAAVASSAGFAIWHIVPTRNLVLANRPGAAPATVLAAVVAGVAAAFAAGLALAGLRLELGLVAAFALHAVLNGASTVAAFLATRKVVTPAPE
ncbi:MAG: CPBP family glutamic-type intramembrane protease [Actinomycetota bacterium]